MPFRRKPLAWLAVIFGALASTLAFWAIRHADIAAQQANFNRRTETFASVIERSLRNHEEALYSLRNLFEFSHEVTRREFDGMAADLISRHPGVQALEWAKRVPGSQRAAVEAAVRAEGFPDFQFADRDQGPVLKRSPDRPEHLPVLYIYPYVGNKAALGFDLTSGITWPDLKRSAAQNRPTSSGRLPLITDGQSMDWGYILNLPVYGAAVPDSPTERQDLVQGYVLGVFRVADMIESFVDTTKQQGGDMLVIDESASADQQFLHFHASRQRTEPIPTPSAAEMQESEFSHVLHLHFGDRKWTLYFRPTPQWIAAQKSNEALAVLFGGLLSSLLLGLVLHLQQRRTALVEQEVNLRTAELEEAQARLSADVAHRTEAERRLANLIRHLPGAAFRCALDQHLTAHFVSDGIFQLTGFPAEDFICGRAHLADLTLPADRPGIRQHIGRAVQERTFFEAEYRARHRSGEEKWILVRGQPIFAEDGTLRFLEGLAIDVTAIKQAESEKISIERKMLEAQKLESLGVLAGGIAHDFNNILTAVLANAELARATLAGTEPAAPHLEQIRLAARRAADLCQQMLAYAGRGQLQTASLDLSKLVRDTTALLEVSVAKNCRLDLHLADGMPPVLADPTQLRQIVMNLVINASDAIGTRPDGRIAVSTYARPTEAAELQSSLHHPQLPAGLYVGIEVTDNGGGMAPETVRRIFEPFFTTKFSGRGLGLSAVLGIVQSHRGALFVDSQLGVGSTFRLLLPATARPESSRAAGAATAPERIKLTGTFLVVDDEDSVRSVTATVLRVHGGTVLEAADGMQALRICKEHEGRIDLILLDLTMPGISGEETLRRLRMLNHPHRVLVMSGYSEQETKQRCAELGTVGFLHKPFELDDLLAKIQALLG